MIEKLNSKKIYVKVIILTFTVIMLSFLLKEPYAYENIQYYMQMSITPPLSEYYVNFIIVHFPLDILLIISALLMCFGIYGLIYMDDQQTIGIIKAKKEIIKAKAIKALLYLRKITHFIKFFYSVNEIEQKPVLNGLVDKKSKLSKANQYLKIIGGIVLVYVIVFSCNKILSNTAEEDIKNSMEKISAKKEIQNTARMMTKTLPKTIDANTTVTKVEYLENINKLIFYYEVNNANKEDVESKISNLKADQIQFIKNNPNNGAYLKAEVIFEYIYSDLNGTKLGSYIILPNEYM